jgi:hypothetical protein
VAGWVFFITQFDREVKILSRVFPQRKKSFEVLVQLRWAMKNALVPAPPFG